MRHLSTHLATFLLMCLLLLLSACAEQKIQPSLIEPEKHTPQEKTDSSCSYFYFLWGSHAEYEERYEEALEAYEKASLCDPDAEYIAEKIPVLLIHLGRIEEATMWLENYITQKPHKTVQRFMLARLKIQQGKEDEAIVLYKHALGLEPDNPNIKLRLGLLYGKKGDIEIAESIFQDILNNNENAYFALLYLSRLYAKAGKLSKAEYYYLKALNLNWSNDLAFEIAEFYNLRKEFNKAQNIYSDILCHDEENERAALGIVQSYLFLQEGEAALHELTRIREFSNSPERIDLLRSQILINLGEIRRAKDVLEKLLVNNEFAQAYYLLGIIYYEEFEFDKSLVTLEKISPNAPEYKESVILRARILNEHKESELAIQMLRDVLSSHDSRLPIFYSLLASIYERSDRNNEALNILYEGVSHYQEDEALLYEYAIILEKTIQHEQAMAIMKKLLKLNPNHPDALNFIGYSWADRNIHLNKAYQYIKKALELKPNSGYILDSLGWVYYRMGDYPEAKDKLLQALELEPEDPFIYEHLGDTCMKLGEPKQAVEFYKKSLQLLSDEKKKESILEKIDTINN